MSEFRGQYRLTLRGLAALLVKAGAPRDLEVLHVHRSDRDISRETMMITCRSMEFDLVGEGDDAVLYGLGSTDV